MYYFHMIYYIVKIDLVNDDKMPHSYLGSIKFPKENFKIQYYYQAKKLNSCRG